MDADALELRDRIVAVEEAQGSDLLTVAIPADGSVGKALERVEEERATAEYIDSDERSRGERAALEQVRRVLSGYDETPANGLVVYAGPVEGESDPVTYVFDDLPSPVPSFVFERGHEFDTEPLESVGETPTYGLLVVERGGAAVGVFHDGGVEPVETIDSDVMGKHRAGGQSAQRFARRREEQKADFFETVASEAERAFSEHDVDGVLLGGTTVTVDAFREGDYLPDRLADAVLGAPVPVEHASERGLRELAEKARDRREEFARRPAAEALDEFFTALARETPVAYGPESVERALEFDAVDTLLVSADRDVAAVRGYEQAVESEGGDCVVVPPDLPRAERFEEAFDGVGALLRFPIE